MTLVAEHTADRHADGGVLAGIPLPAHARILDLGPTDAVAARRLREGGWGRYVGLVPPVAFSAVRADAGELASRFRPLDDAFDVAAASADLLILRGPFVRLLWSLQDLMAYRWVAVDLSVAEGRAAAELARRRGRLARIGVHAQWGTPFAVYALADHPPPRARIHFSPHWGVEGLASRLAAAGIDYAVLRWFDALPHMDAGEDLDILVRDEHVDAFRALVQSEPGTIPIDLYSASGREGSDFQGAAYYVPELAARILDGAVVHSSGMRVPSPIDHLHSLAYHALYHKGVHSGLATSSSVGSDEPPEHDYRVAIATAARDAGRTVPLDMEGLEEELAVQGWRPPLDALRRLSEHNPWLRERIGATHATIGAPEPAVFLVRERTLEHFAADTIAGSLEPLGFEIVWSGSLAPAARERATRAIRGGNWAAGPYPVSGGPPVFAIVAVHYAPEPVDPAWRHRYPHLSNADILTAKTSLRALVESTLDPEQTFNPMHSADDPHEAWEYLEIIDPDLAARLRDDVGARLDRQQPPQGTVRTLSRGRRARVDVVRRESAVVVRKTFAAAGRRHLARELHALTALGVLDAVPPVLARGHDWIEIPYYDDRLDRDATRLLPLRVVRRMVAILADVHRHGFDLVDAKPDNFVLDRAEGLRLVDLEFAYPAADTSRSLASGPVFQEPRGFVDVPVGDSSYDVRWRARTGLSLRVLLNAPPLIQHVHRCAYRVHRATLAPGSRLRKGVRRVVDASHAVRRGVRHIFLACTRARASTAARAARATTPTTRGETHA